MGWCVSGAGHCLAREMPRAYLNHSPTKQMQLADCEGHFPDTAEFCASSPGGGVSGNALCLGTSLMFSFPIGQVGLHSALQTISLSRENLKIKKQMYIFRNHSGIKRQSGKTIPPLPSRPPPSRKGDISRPPFQER